MLRVVVFTFVTVSVKKRVVGTSLVDVRVIALPGTVIVIMANLVLVSVSVTVPSAVSVTVMNCVMVSVTVSVGGAAVGELSGRVTVIVLVTDLRLPSVGRVEVRVSVGSGPGRVTVDSVVDVFNAED